MTKKYKVRIVGVSPLIQNRFSIEESMQKGRKKQIPSPEEECEKALYKTEAGEVYLPNLWIKTAMVKAATDFKMEGKKSYKEYIKAGIVVEPEQIPLKADKYEVFVSRCVIQRAAIAKARPKFKTWEAEFEIELLDEMLNPTIVKEILDAAGRFKGIGDWRPEHGRFKVEKFEL